jgi:putative nucleotidyltransferase with HDIG domain
MRDRRIWEWSARLSAAGIQRIEFDADVTQPDLEGFIFDLIDLLAHQHSSATARPAARRGIRYGAVALKNQEGHGEGRSHAGLDLGFTLQEEVETVAWLHEEVRATGVIPLIEAETIVRSLWVAMHADRHVVLPLLRLRGFDEYTTTHSLNVSVLTMALAEWLGLSDSEIRAYGVAGLLHDIGKICIPHEILVKQGRLTDDERAVMNRHPTDGARLILKADDTLDLAAVVAYEHHVMIDGAGYPAMRFGRMCHPASRLVHVCDVFDALRTNRPYRDAWALQQTLTYIQERAGVEFDPAILKDFMAMIGNWESQLCYIRGESTSSLSQAS